MQLWRVGWYRFRTTFRLRAGGLVTITLMIAVVGGLAIGSIAGARRTQSSFPSYLARIHARNFAVLTAIAAPGQGTTPYDAAVVKKIARLPLVKQVADFTIVDPNIAPLAPLHMRLAPGESPPNIGGSLDGEFSSIDDATLTSGRLADPKQVDEVVMSAGAAREFGMHVGSTLRVGFFTNRQQLPGLQPQPGTKLPRPHLSVDLHLVGIVVLHTEVIEDDVDALADSWVILTPALMRELVPCCAFVTETGIRIEGGDRNVPAVQAELARALPELTGGRSSGDFTATEVEKAERAIEPESIALGVFGGIAALAALLIAAQLVGRQLRRGGDDRMAMRALGAGTATTVADGLMGVAAAVLLGALLAAVVAVAMSPLALLGPVRHVEHPGFAADWTVLGAGVATLVAVLAAAALAIAYHDAPHRVARRERVRARTSRIGRAAGNAGLPASATTGIRFALGSGTGPEAVPMRSAIVGAILAVVVVTGTITFGASLHTLVSRPRLYGWNWDYELLSGFSGQEDLPQAQVTKLLDADRSVGGFAGIYFAGAQIDGKAVPLIGTSPGAPVAPPLLSGHGLDRADEVVLGASSLAMLHEHIGNTVQVRAGPSKPVTLRIVGTATMPAIGNGTTMGTGALVSYKVIPAARRNLQDSTIAGPNAYLVRIRAGADPRAALRSLEQINATVSKGPDGPAGGVVGVLRPAEIVNYGSTGATPGLLGAALAAGALGALALTLVASVRRRRRELALLKTLGFTRRQLAAVVAWQATIAVGIGVVIGAPLGVLAGRTLWDLFARAIHAVPDPSVPLLAVAIVAVGAVVLANVVAAIPGRQAARVRTAVLLHAE